MNGIQKFEKLVGGRWSGVIFHRDEVPQDSLADRKMRFCEAVKESSTGPVTLTSDLISCPGALRSFGWSANGKETFVERLAKMKGIQTTLAEKLLKSTPRFGDGVKAVTLGTYDSPDVLVSYSQPEAAMRLVDQWQQQNGEILNVAVSSVMSVCGWAAVGAYLSGSLCISFGCPESRKKAAIGNDRLVLGLPARLAGDFFAANQGHKAI